MNQINNPFLKSAIQNDFVSYGSDYNFRINLSGQYDFMEFSYYISQEMENAGLKVHPTCKEMLDAYITPILLEKAGAGGVAVPAFYISNGYFEPPVIIDPINPFMIKSRTVISSKNTDAIAKSMTRNYTYAICCQELPQDSKVRKFRSVLGWSIQRQYRDVSAMVWDVFRIPLAVVRVIIQSNNEILLSDISPLPLKELTPKEFDYLKDKVRWEK